MKKNTKTKSITIGHLYADLMNIYGDDGNIIALQKRCEWRGIKVQILRLEIGDKIKANEVDIYFFGGGQDQAQTDIANDLIKLKGHSIRADIERGVPLLSICGGYQLLGDYYKPHEGDKLPGLGIFPAYTEASHDRMIGNIVIKTKNLGKLVGFENHSGKTYLKDPQNALGTVITGFGNNGEDQTEGCVYKNAIGCYMHGSLLPKNPDLADWLIEKALEVKYGEKVELKPLDDKLENLAHEIAIKKFSK